MYSDEYVQLMYFYRNFIKDVLAELMKIIGKRGTVAVLRESSRRYALSKINSNPISQKGFATAFKFLLGLGKPEVSENQKELFLRKCPFKVKTFKKAGTLEEMTFCNICWGFINGIANQYNGSIFGLVQNRARGSKFCKFKALN